MKHYIPPPSEKQKRFLSAKTKHIGFGGARGGGKNQGKAAVLQICRYTVPYSP